MERKLWMATFAVVFSVGACAEGSPMVDTGPIVAAPPMGQPPATAGIGGPITTPVPPGTRPPGSGDVITAGKGGPVVTAGAGAAPMAGNGAAPMAGMGSMGTAGMAPVAGNGAAGGPAVPPPGAGKPIVPMVAGECPSLDSGTITFMGLGGITVASGAKPSAPTAPMVFYWHGTGSFAGEYAGSAAAVVAGVRAEGGVLISFQNTKGGDLLSGTFIFGAGDFELTDQLLACAVTNRNVDPTRVFATGCSAGGLFSGAMAAMRSNYIAAAAPNSGGWTTPVRWQNDWTPALMTMHGAPGVDVVVIDFSTSSATADKAFKARGGFVINCNHGGIHCGAGGLSGDVWEFFKAHPYGTKPSPWASALPAGFSSQCKLYM